MIESTLPAWVQTSLPHLEAKDILTLAVSMIALIVSLTNVLHSIVSKRTDTERSARSEFAEIVEDLVDLKQTREDLRREMGDDWGKHKNAGVRVNLNDKRELLLSRAVFLQSKYHMEISDIQYTIIGSVLSDSGRHSESLRYYSRAVDVAPSPLAQAWARRPYGRALILAGDSDRGRKQMLTAVSEFDKLIAEPGLDADAMRFDRADVFRRLIWAQIQGGMRTHIDHDYERLVSLTAEIRNPDGRKALEDAIEELDGILPDHRVAKPAATTMSPVQNS